MPDFAGFVVAIPLTSIQPHCHKIISWELVGMARPRRDKTPSTAPNKQRLSHFAVKNLQPRERPYTVWDSLQRGFAIVVQPSGHTAWKAVYSHHGRPRWYHIADASKVGLADARKLAARIMLQVAGGSDPQAARRAERSADSFEELATRYRKYSERKNKSWKQADALVRKHLLPRWAKLPAPDITRTDVKALIASIDAPITANQVLASASAIFSWANKQDIPGLTVNPCHGVERNKTTRRERVLSDNEVPLFWSAFDAAGLEGVALKAILLCGQRPGEIANMRTEHIESNWWSMPGGVIPALNWPGTKNGQSHRVFLPAPLQQIIADMDTTGRVFADVATDQMSKVMRAICKQLNVARLTPHDLRRTHGSTITGLGFGRDAMNRIQNHREGGIADVYDQHQYAEENQRIMEAVAAKIFSLINPSPLNVLPFQKAVSA
jgi:integrase